MVKPGVSFVPQDSRKGHAFLLGNFTWLGSAGFCRNINSFLELPSSVLRKSGPYEDGTELPSDMVAT